MDRKVPFLIGETYHVYTRGVEKRVVFETNADHEHMQLLLYLCNGAEAVHMRTYRGLPSAEVFERGKRCDPLVDILAYALMPNHFHLLLRERIQGGISRFMLKLMTAYSMYFNAKRERSGPLFTRPFRSRHVDNDAYLRWIFAYILLNPLELHQSDWKEIGIRDIVAARTFMQEYRYGSLRDHMTIRPSCRILAADGRVPNKLEFDALLELFADTPNRGESLTRW